MSNSIPPDSAQCLNYHDGMFLTAANMTIGQNYFSNWITLQNQYLYTPGVLGGLSVTLSSNTLIVAGGTAIDSNGDFLIFPGDSGNQMPATTGCGNPYGLFLVYPPTVQSTQDIVNQAAVLQNVNLQFALPTNAVQLATVHLQSDTSPVIQSIDDARVPVTSRLPAVLGTTTALQATAVTNLNQALQGSAILDTRALLKPGDSVSQVVFYRVDKLSAFSAVPNVYATPVNSPGYAVNLAGIDTTQFTLTLSAVQTRTDVTPSTQVNWLALPNSLTPANL